MSGTSQNTQNTPADTLADFQAAFWRALWSADAPTDGPPDAPWAQPGFAVYRNTVLRGGVEALVSLYPAVRRLAGDAWLRAVALEFVRTCPPAHGELQRYGDGFPAFIAQALADDALPWLGEVARVDRLWSECHVAADAAVLTPAALAGGDAAGLARARLRPHPAARWHWCDDWPVFSLWHAARGEAADPNPPHWRGEGVLLTRASGAVTPLAIDAAECALLDACAQGLALGDALATVHTHFHLFDPGLALGRLLNQGAFSGAEETPCP